MLHAHMNHFMLKVDLKQKISFSGGKIFYTMFLPCSTKQKFGLISRIFPGRIKEGRICFETLNYGSNLYLNNIMKKIFSETPF